MTADLALERKPMPDFERPEGNHQDGGCAGNAGTDSSRRHSRHVRPRCAYGAAATNIATGGRDASQSRMSPTGSDPRQAVIGLASERGAVSHMIFQVFGLPLYFGHFGRTSPGSRQQTNGVIFDSTGNHW